MQWENMLISRARVHIWSVTQTLTQLQTDPSPDHTLDLMMKVSERTLGQA